MKFLNLEKLNCEIVALWVTKCNIQKILKNSNISNFYELSKPCIREYSVIQGGQPCDTGAPHSFPGSIRSITTWKDYSNIYSSSNCQLWGQGIYRCKRGSNIGSDHGHKSQQWCRDWEGAALAVDLGEADALEPAWAMQLRSAVASSVKLLPGPLGGRRCRGVAVPSSPVAV